MTITVLFICVGTLSITITTILKIWGTLIMTVIITITRKFQYDFEYNCHTQNMGNIDYDYLLQSPASSNMTLSITTILRIWGMLNMTIIITIDREF